MAKRRRARRRARDHRLIRELYLRGLGLVAVAAYTSLRRQLPGLIGERGISPYPEIIEISRRHYGRVRLDKRPTLFWFTHSDAALLRAARAGQVAGALLALGIAPKLCALALYGLQLSLVNVGSDFLSFQWESLLAENFTHAAIIAPLRLRPGLGTRRVGKLEVALMRWLLLRLHFESGIVKARATDRAWVELEAMEGYYETAPLPTPLGWYAHQLPRTAHRASTAAALAIECAAPLVGLGTRKMRMAALAAVSLLQLLIMATGNYGFFNLLTLIMGLWYLDDDALPAFLRRKLEPPARLPSRLQTALAVLFGGSVACLSVPPLLMLLGAERIRWPAWLRTFRERLAPFELGNSYGPFSLMTRIRPELTIEGSADGQTWKPYRFRFKIDDVKRRPRWVAPHQPRLDWQMWFAALDPVPPWMLRFLKRLLEGSPSVLALLAENPFPERPPKQIRVVQHLYRMTTRAERRATGARWSRVERGEVVPPLSLRSFEDA